MTHAAPERSVTEAISVLDGLSFSRGPTRLLAVERERSAGVRPSPCQKGRAASFAANASNAFRFSENSRAGRCAPVRSSPFASVRKPASSNLPAQVAPVQRVTQHRLADLLELGEREARREQSEAGA